MNYIGSKFKISDWIIDEVKNVVGCDLSNKTFCDIFAGTGIVGQTVKKEVKQVISNDIEYYSYVLNKNYIENHLEIENKESFIDELNDIEPIDNGFIYQNYCMGGGNNRMYFSDANGKKIDAIRQQIERWNTTNKIQKNLYFYLLASLIKSADKVANTTSVYGAHLKSLKQTAQKHIILRGAGLIINDNEHEVYREDANKLINKIRGDILYLDPPYNRRQYGANYHLLNTIALYDRFTPQGKTGLREYTKSKYCRKTEVFEAFEHLISKAKFKYIFMSYNNEGLMSSLDIQNILKKYGEYTLVSKEYPRYKADSKRYNKTNRTTEYLHILIKN